MEFLYIMLMILGYQIIRDVVILIHDQVKGRARTNAIR
jgi:hypothetical protein